jgi:ribose/xylose/arabinose/galactoside ABC-type transport system permease subunit
VIHCPLSVRLRSLSQFLIILAVAAECLVFGFLSSSFLTLNNFVNVALQIAIYGVLAVGMTLVIITGGIDLSVGSVVALAGVMAAGVLEKMTGHPRLGIGLAVAVGIGIGTLSGAFSGLMITRLRVPPFIVTLALMTVCRGLAFIFTGGFSIGNLPLGFGFLGRDHLGPIPVPVVTMAIVFLGGYLLLSKSYKGRYIYAIGGNEEASRLSGIDTRRVVLQVYLLNGSLAGLAGITLASRLGAGVPNSGLQYELDVIAAVVVGGTSLMGGVGSIAGTFWGTVFIGILNNGLNLANVDPYTQKVALGVVILLAVLLDRMKK